MSHSAAWDKTTPLGTDLASSIDNFMRDMKRDVEERMQLDHIWSTSLDHDGKHLRVRLRPAANVIPIEVEAGNTISGSTVGGLFSGSQTWNTSGVSSGLTFDITNSASGSGSSLINLKVNGTTVFKVDLSGEVVVGSISGAGLGNVGASSDFGTDNVLVRSNGTAKSVQSTGITVDDSNNITGIANLSFSTLSVFSWNNKAANTVHQAASDGFIVLEADGSSIGGLAEQFIYTDASNPPTTLQGQNNTVNDRRTVTVPVRKGDYWKVSLAPFSGSVIYSLKWVPLGTGGA